MCVKISRRPHLTMKSVWPSFFLPWHQYWSFTMTSMWSLFYLVQCQFCLNTSSTLHLYKHSNNWGWIKSCLHCDSMLWIYNTTDRVLSHLIINWTFLLHLFENQISILIVILSDILNMENFPDRIFLTKTRKYTFNLIFPHLSLSQEYDSRSMAYLLMFTEVSLSNFKVSLIWSINYEIIYF